MTNAPVPEPTLTPSLRVGYVGIFGGLALILLGQALRYLVPGVHTYAEWEASSWYPLHTVLFWAGWAALIGGNVRRYRKVAKPLIDALPEPERQRRYARMRVVVILAVLLFLCALVPFLFMGPRTH